MTDGRFALLGPFPGMKIQPVLAISVDPRLEPLPELFNLNSIRSILPCHRPHNIFINSILTNGGRDEKSQFGNTGVLCSQMKVQPLSSSMTHACLVGALVRFLVQTSKSLPNATVALI